MLSRPVEQQQISSALDRQGRQREDMYGQQTAAIAVNSNPSSSNGEKVVGVILTTFGLAPPWSECPTSSCWNLKTWAASKTVDTLQLQLIYSNP